MVHLPHRMYLYVNVIPGGCPPKTPDFSATGGPSDARLLLHCGQFLSRQAAAARFRDRRELPLTFFRRDSPRKFGPLQIGTTGRLQGPLRVPKFRTKLTTSVAWSHRLALTSDFERATSHCRNITQRVLALRMTKNREKTCSKASVEGCSHSIFRLQPTNPVEINPKHVLVKRWYMFKWSSTTWWESLPWPFSFPMDWWAECWLDNGHLNPICFT